MLDINIILSNETSKNKNPKDNNQPSNVPKKDYEKHKKKLHDENPYKKYSF